MSDSAHIFIFLGDDELAVRKEADKASAIFSDATTAGMNTSRLDARNASENDLANAVGSMPFLASQRLVVLEYVSKRFNGLDGHKKFLAFLDGVPTSARVVILENEEIKPKEIANYWLVKWATKNADRAEYKVCLLPKAQEMPGWIMAETKRQKGSIEREAAARLAEMTGTDTRQAAQEITKLLTYVNYAHTISLEEVEEVSIVTARVDIFELVDAMGMKNGRLAQKLLHRLLEEKDVFEIFGLVVRQFRLLVMARDILDGGGMPQEVAGILGLHPFVGEKVAKQAQAFEMRTLDAVYHRLLAMDEASKSGGMPLEASLDMLIVELAGGR